MDPRDPLLHCERTHGLRCGSRLRKGEEFAYVGLPQNLKDLKWGLLHSIDGTRSIRSMEVVKFDQRELFNSINRGCSI